MSERIGFGGGCHWCTEAVFESLLGVTRVEQGWLAPANDTDNFSGAVLIEFEPGRIDLDTLVAVHLHTHSCTSNHALRGRYRSAVHVFSAAQAQQTKDVIARLQVTDFDLPIITQVRMFGAFRGNEERYLHYGQRHAGQPFCERFINPKLKLLRERFAAHARTASMSSAAIDGSNSNAGLHAFAVPTSAP